MTIMFTEYVLPNGMKQPKEFNRSDRIEKMAEDLIEHGAYFDYEILRNGLVSMTAEMEDGEIILAAELCHPQYEEIFVDNLIKKAHSKL